MGGRAVDKEVPHLLGAEHQTKRDSIGGLGPFEGADIRKAREILRGWVPK